MACSILASLLNGTTLAGGTGLNRWRKICMIWNPMFIWFHWKEIQRNILKICQNQSYKICSETTQNQASKIQQNGKNEMHKHILQAEESTQTKREESSDSEPAWKDLARTTEQAAPPQHAPFSNSIMTTKKWVWRVQRLGRKWKWKFYIFIEKK